jgi:hypothetical protein
MAEMICFLAHNAETLDHNAALSKIREVVKFSEFVRHREIVKSTSLNGGRRRRKA